MPISIAGSGAVTGASTLNGLTVPTDAIAPGLVLISSQTFNSVSSVSINNCFTSNYENYHIKIQATASTGTPSGYLLMRSSGTDRTGSVYNSSQNYGTGNNAYTGTTNVLFSSLATEPCPTAFDIFGPALTGKTHGVGLCFRSTSPLTFMSGFLHNESISVDGFTFYTSGATMSGFIKIYGYRNMP